VGYVTQLVTAAPSRPQRSSADNFMRALLRIHDPEGEPELHRMFSTSILLSATRCLLSYIVFPILTPTLGVAAGVGPFIGIPIGIVALVFDVRAIRRFFIAEHRWRWAMLALYLVVMVTVSQLIVRDITHLA
jgi:hypothetical protein